MVLSSQNMIKLFGVILTTTINFEISSANIDIFSTGYGMKECKMWPYFLLQDYNPSSGSYYLQSYGLSDVHPKPDVTIVGLYFADSEVSQDIIVKQEKIGKDLATERQISISNIALNYFAPLSCAVEECELGWWDNWWNNDVCDTYIGGCAADDYRLESVEWQDKLTSITSIPLMQDTFWEDAWDRFGGGEGDLFIYDSTGRLYKYFCGVESLESKLTKERCEFTIGPDGMWDSASEEIVKKAIIEAAASNGTERCGSINDDEFLYYYNDYYDYYYSDDLDKYDDDDAEVALDAENIKADAYDDDGDDDDDDSSSKSEDGNSDSGNDNDDDVEDDDESFDDDDADDTDDRLDKIKRLRRWHTKDPKKHGLPGWIYTSFLFVSFTGTVAFVMLYRYRSLLLGVGGQTQGTQASMTYSRLAVDEHAVEMPAAPDQPDELLNNDGGYGSL